MNDLDQLRATLEDHVGGLADPDLAARPAAVRRRVAVVRRRRRVTAAVGAVAVLAVAVGLSVPRLGGGDDAGPVAAVVGVPVPAHLDSLGFRYDFAEGVGGHDGTAVLRLSAADRPRLVSWATSGADNAVVVTGPDGGPLAVDGKDFGDWTFVPAGSPVRVRVHVAHGEPGLAVYTLSPRLSDRPAGLTRDGVTFRDDVAGQRLLGAVVGRPGQARVHAAATATGPGVRVAYYCADGPADAWLHVALGSGGAVDQGAGCDDGVPVDAASGSDYAIASRPGADRSVRMWVTHGEHGPLVRDPDLRIGAGVYATAIAPLSAAATRPPQLERYGHRWTRVATATSPAGGRRVVATAPADRGEVLVVGTGDLAGASVDLAFDTAPGTGATLVTAPGATERVVAAGTRATLALRGGGQPGAGAAVLAFYVRAD